MSRKISPGLRSGSLPLLVTLMTLLAGLALAGLTGIQTLANGWSQAARSAATIEIPPNIPQPADRTATLIQTLKKTPGVTNVHPLSPQDVQTLLTPWLGQTASHNGLTLPSVIIVAHTPGTTIEHTVQSLLPEAIVQEDHQWGERLDHLGQSLLTCAWLAVLLIAGIAILSIGITVRRSISAQKRDVEIVHALGARDMTIACHIAGRAAWLSFLGSMIGLILLAPLTASLAKTLAPFTHHTTPLTDWSATLHILPTPLLTSLIALPAFAALLGWFTAQGVVLAWLRKLP